MCKLLARVGEGFPGVGLTSRPRRARAGIDTAMIGTWAVVKV
jgi:hypothetical protein